MKTLLGSIAAIVIFFLTFTPYVAIELIALSGALPYKPAPAENYWQSQEIAPGIFAIGELEFYQYNWHYLVVGKNRAILFDTGTGQHGIRAYAEKLTDRPITAMVSHFHYDHSGNLHEFDRVAMLDLPSARAQMDGDMMIFSRYSQLGFVDGLRVKPAKITDWIDDGGTIDLGDRQLRFYAVPGHTTDSIVLHDPKNNMLLTGDYIYPGDLFSFLPNSSRSSYVASAQKLLANTPEDIRLFAGHGSVDNPTIPPEMPRSLLQNLYQRMKKAETGELAYTGIFPRSLNIEGDIHMLTGFGWHNH